jgi:hypothetical protein
MVKLIWIAGSNAVSVKRKAADQLYTMFYHKACHETSHQHRLVSSSFRKLKNLEVIRRLLRNVRKGGNLAVDPALHDLHTLLTLSDVKSPESQNLAEYRLR